MNKTTKSFKKLFDDFDKSQALRLKSAGKHRCVKSLIGVARRVTRQDGEPLKRPVVVQRFYECKICGKDMR